MAKKKKIRKGSRQANLMIRWNAIQKGLRDAKPTSPEFVIADGRIHKIPRDKYNSLEEEAADLSGLTGIYISVADLLPKRKRRKNRSHKSGGSRTSKAPKAKKTPPSNGA